MLKKLLLILGIMVALLSSVSFILGTALVKPQQRELDSIKSVLAFESVLIPSQNAYQIAAWFVQGRSEMSGILLLHSVRSNRLEMLDRAEFLNKAGYSVLLIDMQAHGETPGEHITFGYRESFDAHSALDYLKKRIPDKKVGVIGVSLGGAAALLGDKPLNADALVLEAVYSNIKNAIKNRLAIRIGKVGRLFSPFLELQIEPRLGIATKSLAPISAIQNLESPVLIIAGENDQRTTVIESKKLFSTASQPKELWLIDGAKHQNLHRYTPAAYEYRILKFFEKHLRSDDT